MKALLRRLRRVLESRRMDVCGWHLGLNSKPTGFLRSHAESVNLEQRGVVAAPSGKASFDSSRVRRIRCISEPCADTRLAAASLRGESRFPRRPGRTGALL
jgi:hypothetical protein